MAQSHNYDGQQRTCPYCGQTSVFIRRTLVPGTGIRAVAPGGKFVVAEYKPGWTCENKSCSQRYDFNL